MESLTFRNAWIVSVKGGERRIGGLAALGIAGCVLLCGIIGGPWLHHIWANRYRPDAPPATLFRILYYFAVFLPIYVCIFLAPFWERRAPLRSRFKPWNGLGLGIAIGGFAFLSVMVALSLTGILQQHASAQELGLGIVLVTALTAFQAFGEEGFFRGWLQPIVAADWGPAAGLAVTAAVFAGAHLFAEMMGPVAVLNLFLAGVVFGLLALRTGGLAASFGAHWTWNWLEQSVMGLVPNPGVDSLGSFFDFDLVGSRLLSGGAEGLNGSLAVTAALLAFGAALYVVPSQQESAVVRAGSRAK